MDSILSWHRRRKWVGISMRINENSALFCNCRFLQLLFFASQDIISAMCISVPVETPGSPVFCLESAPVSAADVTKNITQMITLTHAYTLGPSKNYAVNCPSIYIILWFGFWSTCLVPHLSERRCFERPVVYLHQGTKTDVFHLKLIFFLGSGCRVDDDKDQKDLNWLFLLLCKRPYPETNNQRQRILPGITVRNKVFPTLVALCTKECSAPGTKHLTTWQELTGKDKQKLLLPLAYMCRRRFCCQIQAHVLIFMLLLFGAVNILQVNNRLTAGNFVSVCLIWDQLYTKVEGPSPLDPPLDLPVDSASSSYTIIFTSIPRAKSMVIETLRENWLHLTNPMANTVLIDKVISIYLDYKTVQTPWWRHIEGIYFICICNDVINLHMLELESW